MLPSPIKPTSMFVSIAPAQAAGAAHTIFIRIREIKRGAEPEVRLLPARGSSARSHNPDGSGELHPGGVAQCSQGLTQKWFGSGAQRGVLPHDLSEWPHF